MALWFYYRTLVSCCFTVGQSLAIYLPRSYDHHQATVFRALLVCDDVNEICLEKPPVIVARHATMTSGAPPPCPPLEFGLA